ncbi:MAG: RNA-processing protein [Candidatus Aenigmarchaeota archaeon]|nr:RNA-processing protein [Candidatus Aenigmarchaeota archaeon]
MIEEINIPEERKPVLIGKQGQTRAELENRSGTTITIHDSVTVEGDDPIVVMKAAEVVKAVGRGFSPEKAMLLLNEDYELRIITMQGESEKTIKRLMARVIGSGGATRKILEKDTNCLVSVYGKTVSLIGKLDEIDAAEKAVEELLRGRSHGYVYSRLRK